MSEEAPLTPISPYGRSKLMVEWMLEDAARAYDFRYVALRYFNVAGADPKGRLGQSTPNATHLIKRGVQTALGVYPSMDIFGEDYPTRDGTCVRDYIQVTDLIDAHLAALAYLRGGGESLTCNCGYGHGATVKEVIDVVKRVSGVDFKVNHVAAPRGRPGGDRRQGRAGAKAARLAAEARRSRRDRPPGARLGAAPAQPRSGRPIRPDPPVARGIAVEAADGRALQARARRALTRQNGNRGNACGRAVGGNERRRYPRHRGPQQVLRRLRGGQRRQS